jgi:hypothetical protein
MAICLKWPLIFGPLGYHWRQIWLYFLFPLQIVYDISLGTDEVDKLKPWLANIHARAPHCPVVIVGTHFDLILAGEQNWPWNLW